MTLPQATTDPKQWRNLSDEQRLNLIEAILIEHPNFNRIYNEIEYCAQFGSDIETTSPPCLAILGKTGAGKTTLALLWESMEPRQETLYGRLIPYLYVSIPRIRKSGVKNVASAFLQALGDPNPSRGTEWNMKVRIYQLLKSCRVKMILLDEFQHLVNKDNDNVSHDAADFLKDIINETRRPMVLFGQQGEAERILKANSQLERRVGSPRILEPIKWLEEEPATIAQFRTVMRTIDELLPFDTAQLGSFEMAYRFHYASEGYLGWVMELVRYASIRAIRTGSNTISLPLLEEAYKARVAGTSMGLDQTSQQPKENPFSSQFNQKLVARRPHLLSSNSADLKTIRSQPPITKPR
jgi:hypothetical protein